MLVKQFKVRISQHQGSSVEQEIFLTCLENSKIFEQSLNSGHPVTENFKILDCCDNFDIKF